jgi:hypothetical protein
VGDNIIHQRCMLERAIDVQNEENPHLGAVAVWTTADFLLTKLINIRGNANKNLIKLQNFILNEWET